MIKKCGVFLCHAFLLKTKKLLGFQRAIIYGIIK